MFKKNLLIGFITVPTIELGPFFHVTLPGTSDVVSRISLSHDWDILKEGSGLSHGEISAESPYCSGGKCGFKPTQRIFIPLRSQLQNGFAPPDTYKGHKLKVF